MNFQANQFKEIAARVLELEREKLAPLSGEPIEDDFNVFRVYFDSGSVSVEADQKDVIERALRCIERQPGCKITINGHTDKHGARAANMNLGAERALAVGAELMNRGVAGAGMEFQSFGPTAPRLIPGSGEESEDKWNRRVEIILG